MFITDPNKPKIERLKELKELYEGGVLDEAEMKAEKEIILNSSNEASELSTGKNNNLLPDRESTNIKRSNRWVFCVVGGIILIVILWLLIKPSSNADINLSGDWEGPHGLLLTIEQKAQSDQVEITFFGFYRTVDWPVKAELDGNTLRIKNLDDNSPQIDGAFNIDSPQKMSGNLTIDTGGSAYDYTGFASFEKTSQSTAESLIFDMGGATYKYIGAEDGLELYFAPVATHRVDGSMWAQDVVELQGNYEINGYEVVINLDNSYIGTDGLLSGTFSQDMRTLTIHNYSESPYMPSTIIMKLNN